MLKQINTTTYGIAKIAIGGTLIGSIISYLLLKEKLTSTIDNGFFFQIWFWIFLLAVASILLLLIVVFKSTKLKKDKQALEAEISQYTSQVERGKTLIAEQSAKLEQLNISRTQFFTNITHEIRTPLTLILGPAEQMLANGLPKSYKPEVRVIKENAEYLLDTINQLLDISKIESSSMQLNYAIGDIIAFTEGLVQRFKPLATEKQHDLIFESDLVNWETCFDKDKFNNIVYNLLGNAIKFTPSGGQIKLNLTKVEKDSKEYIVLSVKDTGIGIAKANLSKIFDRFYRVNTTVSQKKESTGIGLSLIKELIEFQGGTIEVSSELGKGTFFQVTLPVLSPEKDKSTTEVITDSETVLSSNKSLEKVTVTNTFDILLIDDNPDIRAFIRKSIAQETYTIREANNGEEGVKLALSHTPDLIISDIMMPLKSGYEVTKAIRSNIKTAHIPIILLTAKNNQDSQLKALKLGADAYLTKPFNAKELKLRIQKLIENRALLQNHFQSNSPNLIIENEPKEAISFAFEQDKQFLKQLETIIEMHLDKTALNGEFISKKVGMSRMSLHRKIKQLTNQSTRVFIREYRLQKAFQWLKEEKEDVTQIAYQVGFSAPGYFSKLFKERFGEVPSRINKNYKVQKSLSRKNLPKSAVIG